jgi:hypothetical protein
MPNASESPPDFIDLARHAFASQGYAPSDAVVKAAAKGLARLHMQATPSGMQEAEACFDEMLKRCAHA